MAPVAPWQSAVHRVCETYDSGWRIDYQVATDALAARVQTAVVERAATYAERWSDHAPVTVTYSA